MIFQLFCVEHNWKIKHRTYYFFKYRKFGNFGVGICWWFSLGRPAYSFGAFSSVICSILSPSETDDVLISLNTHLLKNKSDFCCTSKTSIKKKPGKLSNQRIGYVHCFNIGTVYDNKHTYRSRIYVLYTQVHTHNFLSLYHKSCHCSV